MSKIIRLPDVDQLPPAALKAVRALDDATWTEADWADLLRLYRIVQNNIAIRHGLLSAESSGNQRAGETKP